MNFYICFSAICSSIIRSGKASVSAWEEHYVLITTTLRGKPEVKIEAATLALMFFDSMQRPLINNCH